MNEILGVFAGPVLPIAIIVAVLWDRWRSKPTSLPVPDDSEQPYRIFTTDYDLTLAAVDVPRVLAEASPDRWLGWRDTDGSGWRHALDLQAFHPASPARVQQLDTIVASALDRSGLSEPAGELVVSPLVDQSGSLRGSPIVAVQRGVADAVEAFGRAGIRTEVLGFSTAGWQGGFATRRWREQGQPPRPGRLCALLHVIYKTADEASWPLESQRAMLFPDAMRENVDGEALLWAVERLTAVAAHTRVLLVVSDGAPVDDATLLYNGEGYLLRHLRAVIARIEGEGSVRLGGVGLENDVFGIYPCARRSGQDDLALELAKLLSDCLGAPADKPPPLSYLRGEEESR